MWPDRRRGLSGLRRTETSPGAIRPPDRGSGVATDLLHTRARVRITSLSGDASGAVWVSTEGSGFFRLVESVAAHGSLPPLQPGPRDHQPRGHILRSRGRDRSGGVAMAGHRFRRLPVRSRHVGKGAAGPRIQPRQRGPGAPGRRRGLPLDWNERRRDPPQVGRRRPGRRGRIRSRKRAAQPLRHRPRPWRRRTHLGRYLAGCRLAGTRRRRVGRRSFRRRRCLQRTSPP